MSTPMGMIMKKVTISGLAGSGTSTLVRGITEHYGWTSVNGGQIFREEANSRGLTLTEFNDLCSEDESTDFELDEALRRHITNDETNVIESRLAGWWAYKLGSDCTRIWLDVNDKERAFRVAKREDMKLEEALAINARRLLVQNQRYQKMYGLTPEDPTPYTHIIDASDISAEQVLAEALRILGDE